jgi:hypothetical protein
MTPLFRKKLKQLSPRERSALEAAYTAAGITTADIVPELSADLKPLRNEALAYVIYNITHQRERSVRFLKNLSLFVIVYLTACFRAGISADAALQALYPGDRNFTAALLKFVAEQPYDDDFKSWAAKLSA